MLHLTSRNEKNFMTKVSIDILVPVFNEGEKILRLLKLFEKNIKN